MVTDLTMEWQAIGAKPIRADAPAGSPVRDDADFLSMQDEIQKLESLSHEPVNWKQVVAGGGSSWPTNRKIFGGCLCLSRLIA